MHRNLRDRLVYKAADFLPCYPAPPSPWLFHNDPEPRPAASHHACLGHLRADALLMMAEEGCRTSDHGGSIRHLQWLAGSSWWSGLKGPCAFFVVKQQAGRRQKMKTKLRPHGMLSLRSLFATANRKAIADGTIPARNWTFVHGSLKPWWMRLCRFDERRCPIWPSAGNLEGTGRS